MFVILFKIISQLLRPICLLGIELLRIHFFYEEDIKKSNQQKNMHPDHTMKPKFYQGTPSSKGLQDPPKDEF